MTITPKKIDPAEAPGTNMNVTEIPKVPVMPVPDHQEPAWADPDHDFLSFVILDLSGKVLTHASVRCPVNRNSSYPVTLQLEIGHKDGCRRIVTAYNLPQY